MDWKAGDWVIFDMKIGQIKETRGSSYADFSDAFFETSGNLADRFRPLTLRNKHTIETFRIIYDRLNKIAGQRGFNYPRIHDYFCGLALAAIDAPDEKSACYYYEKAQQFVTEANDYNPIIDGVNLFRPN